MTKIDLKFQGICTHLVATHQYDAPRFTLWSNDRVPIQHRVFLANSDLIEKHTPKGRRPKYHVPKLLIRPEEVNGGLAKLFDADGVWRLRDVAISFEGVDVDAGDPFHYVKLSTLPRIWMKADGRGKLRDGVELGWTPFATAYIDFIAGVKFRTKLKDKMWEARGTLYFAETPVLVVRDRNSGDGVRYSLSGVTRLTISNEPEVSVCGKDDYLLHYFATDLDLPNDAPNWFPTEERSEVYCSSSQYP